MLHKGAPDRQTTPQQLRPGMSAGANNMVALAASNGARVGIQRRRSSRRSDSPSSSEHHLQLRPNPRREGCSLSLLNSKDTQITQELRYGASSQPQQHVLHSCRLFTTTRCFCGFPIAPRRPTNLEPTRCVNPVDAVANLAAIAHFVSGVPQVMSRWCGRVAIGCIRLNVLLVFPNQPTP